MFSAGFSFGPLTIRVGVFVPATPALGHWPFRSRLIPAPTIDSHTVGAKLLIEILNVHQDTVEVEIEASVGNGLLSLPSGQTWKPPPCAVPQRLHWGGAYRMEESLRRSANPRRGSETVSCTALRYKQVGWPNWSPWLIPTKGHDVVVTAG